MNRFLNVLGGVLLSVGANGTVWAAAIGGSNPDPMEALSLVTRRQFINVSGASLSSGTAVILTVTDANTTTGASGGAASNLGLHITTTTSASDPRFVGVVHQGTCLNNGVCEVTTYGPELALFACSTSNVTQVATGTNSQVGTSTVAGALGSGTRAGVLLSGAVDTASTTAPGPNGPSVDGCRKWVFVNPVNGS